LDLGTIQTPGKLWRWQSLQSQDFPTSTRQHAMEISRAGAIATYPQIRRRLRTQGDLRKKSSENGKTNVTDPGPECSTYGVLAFRLTLVAEASTMVALERNSLCLSSRLSILSSRARIHALWVPIRPGWALAGNTGLLP
jgi:hypothetical protein